MISKAALYVYYLPAPTILLIRLKTSLGIVAVPPDSPPPPRGASAAAAAPSLLDNRVDEVLAVLVVKNGDV